VSEVIAVDRIDGKARTVRELFTSRRYNVDYYQREYAWSEANVVELLNDLAGRFLDSWAPEHGRQMVANYRPYFLGPIVTDRRDATLFLVDGQQRLTTLTLLLIHLHQLQVDRPETDAVEVKSLIASTSFGSYSFVINVEERLSTMQALLDGDEPPAGISDDSIQNLAARYADLARLFPDELAGKALPYFVDWLLERVVVVEIATSDPDMALEIFETMNDRGLRLTTTDMLKSYLLSKMSDRAKTQDANDRWRTRVTEFTAAEDKTETDFIKHWLRAKYADTIRERNKGATPGDWEVISTAPHKWLRDSRSGIGLQSSSDYQQFFSRDFLRLSSRYLELLEASHKPTPGLESVAYNAYNGVTLQFPLILAAVTPIDDDETFRAKANMVSGFLDLFVARRMVNSRNFGYSTVVYAMFNLAKEIRDLELGELAETLGERTAEMTDTFDALGSFRMHQRNQSHVRYLLARITAWIEKQVGSTLNFADLVKRKAADPFEIEHIWANHLERQPDLTEAAFVDQRNSFGGLLLLPKSFNASYGDMSYEKKLPHYFGQNTLAKSLNTLAYQNHPKFKALIADGLPFQAHQPVDGELSVASMEQRSALYKAVCARIWDPENVGIPVVEPPVAGGPEKTQTYYGVSLKDLLSAGLLHSGMELTGTRGGLTHTATVLGDGRLKIADGSVFSSASAAGAKALNTQSCNGWDFWRAPSPKGPQRLSRLRQSFTESKPHS
jgi:hypothetical protein